MKSRDQMLRKAEQENDSLTFRNQQLTKRLTLLQEDLDEIQVNQDFMLNVKAASIYSNRKWRIDCILKAFACLYKP